MDFWNIDDSATWQEESWSQMLHESLFESVTPGKHVKEQRAKKKNKCDSPISLTKEKKQKRQSSNEERICKDEAVPRKKKKKGNVKHNHEDDVGSKDEVSAKKEKLLPKISSVSSKTVKHITPPDVDKLVTQDGVTSVGNTENASIQSKSKTKTNKKRKRKPRNNKFKVETKGEEEYERLTICDDGGQSQNSEMKESSVESSEPKLSRKERRKLKKKMAKQQLITSKQNQAKNEDKKLDDNSETTHVSKLSQETSIHGSELNEAENEIPDTSSHDDASSSLILATTRRKTQMKRDITLKTQMESQLKSSQFRYLNEQLYKVTGDEAKGMFASDPSTFLTYHEGFTQQVQQWPSNPVDIIIETLKKRPASLVVGDFGCGDAKIARSVKQKVHSFDLYPINKYVTVCDTKKVPLKDGVLDVAVFCLSLMGTNWMDYVKEANRVLKPGGLLKVAEVASRFTSLASFLSVMKSLGFQLKTKDVSNKMFYLFDFKKKQVVTSVPTVNGAILKPCLYKKR